MKPKKYFDAECKFSKDSQSIHRNLKKKQKNKHKYTAAIRKVCDEIHLLFMRLFLQVIVFTRIFLFVLFSGTYFNCIMFMVASSVVSTILILNYHHRNSDTHEMSEWVKYT